MDSTNTLATYSEIKNIAQIDPDTAWLYSGGNRVSVDNEHRDGFIFKESSEKVTSLSAMVLGIKSLHSHRQPNEAEKRKGAPSHALSADWCESFTNRADAKCTDCAAYDACAWKMELTLSIPDREGDFLITIPTVSSMRFREACKELAKKSKRHYSKVIWKMTVHVEKSNGNNYPVLNFEPFDLTTGAELTTASTIPATVVDPRAGLRAALKDTRAALRAASIEPAPMTQAQAADMTADELIAALRAAQEQLPV